jgi:TolB protein
MKIERFPPNPVKIQSEVVLILRLRVFGQMSVAMKFGFFGKLCWVVGLIIAVVSAVPPVEGQSPSGRAGAVIELPPIETALARKQLFVDFGNTSPELAKIARAAFRLHGGYKMVASTQGHHSFEFKATGPTQVSLRISSGKLRRTVWEQAYAGGDQQAAMLCACDGAVSQTWKIPGFFSGKFSFISDRTGSKEIYVGNVLLSPVQAKTNFKKLTFNASWSADGRGIFFTSNRHTFNNVFLLNLPDGRITTVAKYKGNNLRASQNPITRQVAFILSPPAAGNPELFLASSPTSPPKRVTKNRSNESGPCWSPDGKRLIVTSDTRGKPQLYEVSLSTGALSRIPTNLSSHCTEASWNPRDSGKIAFTAAVSGGFQIALFDGQERKSRFLTSGSNDGMQPCWLNDGRHIVFTSRSKSGSKRLMILDTEGVGAKPQALHGADMGNCSQVSFFYPKF